MVTPVSLSDNERYAAFRELNLSEKVRTGWVEEIVSDRPGPIKYTRPWGNLPRGTISQVVRYVVKSNGWELVKVHRYRLPNGQIRGGPDPLYIRLYDVVFTRAKDQLPALPSS